MLMVLIPTTLQARLFPSRTFSSSMFSKVLTKSLLGHIHNEQPKSSNQKIDFLQQQTNASYEFF